MLFDEFEVLCLYEEFENKKESGFPFGAAERLTVMLFIVNRRDRVI